MPEIILPGGAVVETDTTIDGVIEGDTIRFHAEQSADRLLECWKLPNMQALLRTYADEADECERMLWDVIVSRLLDFAEGYTLDLFGKLLEVPRGTRADDPYRARLRVQILIYQSFGRSVNIIGILRALDPAAFVFRQMGVAYFQIDYTEPLVVPAVADELLPVLEAASALGVGFAVGLVYGDPIFYSDVSDDDPLFTDFLFSDLEGGYTGGTAADFRTP